jgi:2,4-dienoyl-CoA reductase-like NADH-dependent reductase (Old Yellow Enzyme family)
MALFDPIALRKLALGNRIVVSPMCQYSAVAGCATDWHLVHWGQLLMSGAGLFTIEATAVTAEGRISPGDLGLYDDATEAALGEMLARARRQAPPMPVALQLAHAGRKASSRAPWEGGTLILPRDGGWQPVAPSALAQRPDEPPPVALDTVGLAAIRAAFTESAIRAGRIGIDALELHFAHGYLLHEFLSPLANARADAYGGTFDNRVRFPLEVFDAVRAAWPAERPLGVRLSCTDWVDGGWTPGESVELARLLVARGCDWIDASSGGVSPAQKIPLGPGYQVPFAREIKRATGATTIAVGMIREPGQAEAIVRDGDADLVAMARAFLWDPRWPWRAAVALGGQVRAPQQYFRAVPREAAAAFGEMKLGQR